MKLSPTQMGLYNLLKDNRTTRLVRVKGGYWVLEGKWPVDSDVPPPGRDANPPVPWVGTRTVDAMFSMGFLRRVSFDEWNWPVYKLDVEGLARKGWPVC